MVLNSDKIILKSDRTGKSQNQDRKVLKGWSSNLGVDEPYIIFLPTLIVYNFIIRRKNARKGDYTMAVKKSMRGYVSQVDRAVAYWELVRLLNQYLTFNEQGEIVPCYPANYVAMKDLVKSLTKSFR
jgi:hypothetical protein